MSIESALTKLSVGTVGLDSSSRSTVVNVLSGSAEISAALEGLSSEAVNILFLVYTGDFHASQRLYLPLVKHIQQVAIEKEWKEFKPKTGKNCWEMLAAIAITEFMHGRTVVRTRNGLSELDEYGQPISKVYRHSDTRIAQIMNIDIKTAKKYKVPMMHMHITMWLEGIANGAAASMMKRLEN